MNTKTTKLSKTTIKLMRKYGCATIEEYRKIRKENMGKKSTAPGTKTTQPTKGRKGVAKEEKKPIGTKKK